jgi:glycosyltransferase involved in cell wall biosynthesis
MTGIGAVVLTRNEEGDVVDCLESLAFCDERVVVDSFSDDGTVQRSLPFAEHVYRRTFTTYASQRTWAIEQLDTPWVLFVDADERVPPALAEEMMAAVRSECADGFRVRRRNFFFGRVMRGGRWGRDEVLRLFRRGWGRVPERAVGETVHMRAGSRIATLRQPMIHRAYADWPGAFERLMSDSTRAALDRASAGRRVWAGEILVSPVARFLRGYVGQMGFRDGLHGFLLCSWGALGVYLRDMKLRLGETRVAPRGPSGPGHDGAIRVETVQGRVPRPGAGDASVGGPGGNAP